MYEPERLLFLSNHWEIVFSRQWIGIDLHCWNAQLHPHVLRYGFDLYLGWLVISYYNGV